MTDTLNRFTSWVDERITDFMGLDRRRSDTGSVETYDVRMTDVLCESNSRTIITARTDGHIEIRIDGQTVHSMPLHKDGTADVNVVFYSAVSETEAEPEADK